MNRKPLITVCALAAGACLSNIAMAAEYGTIVSKTPVFATVSVPQQQCVQHEQLVHQPNTGAGAVLGALVGGGVGNALGGGAGRAAATGLGAVAGAVIGDRVEANANPPVATEVQRCRTVGQLQNQLVGFDVAYDFRGRRYTTRLAADPGNPGGPIALNADATPTAALVVQPTVPAPPPVVISTTPSVVYAAPPVVVSPVVPPVGVRVDAGWGWHRWR